MMERIEEERLRLQAELDAEKTQEARNILGQFATPSRLAEQVLDYAHDLMAGVDAVRFLDPAIGTGSFYSALRRVFEGQRIRRAEGFEIDPHYGEPAVALWQEFDLHLRLADFTAAALPAPEERPNLLICNPPYVRHHHLDQAKKARLAECAARTSGVALSGLSGLYCYFLLIAHSWLAEDGIAGWLIPSEFMDVNYGAGVRRYLTESVELLHIHRYDPAELQFGDAQVSSCLVWFRKRLPTMETRVRMSFGGSLSAPLKDRTVPLNELRGSSKWSGLFRGPALVRSGTAALSDLFWIKRGLATGDNRFFVLSEERAAALSIPKQFLTPVLPSPRYIPSDVIEADSTGMPMLDRRLYLLNCSLPEEVVRRDFPQLADYFATGTESAAQTYICSHRSPWYEQERRPAAPFVCTYMGRGASGKDRPFRFLLNKSDATALNVYLMLYPKPVLARAFAEQPGLREEVWQVLNAIPTSVLLDEGRVYGGGMHKMEPKELARVPADSILALIRQDSSGIMVQSEMFSGLVA